MLFRQNTCAESNPTQENCQSRITNLYSSFDIVKSGAEDTIFVTKQFFPGDSANSCVVDFDIYGSTRNGQVFGIIAHANNARSAVMSNLLFNIKWNHPDSGLVPEVTETELKGFLEGNGNQDYRYQASLNGTYFSDEGVEGISFSGGDACIEGDCIPYTITGDQLKVDGETDQFIYASAENAFAVTSSNDLIAWSMIDFRVEDNRTGWSREHLAGKTWFYIDDDSTGSQPEPMLASFQFLENGLVVMDGEELRWDVANGILTIDFPEGDSDLILGRVNTSGEMVLATNVSGKPIIMTENEEFARGLFYKWVSARVTNQ